MIVTPKPGIDGNYPPAQELLDELDTIADAVGLCQITASTECSRT